MEKPPLLSVKNLSVRFASERGETMAVRDIDFELQPGETLGIVGESGSGKSVTALSLMRLLPPSAQFEAEAIDFWVNGQAPLKLSSLSADEMQRVRGRHMAMIFQEPMTSLNPVYRCGDQVSEAVVRHLGPGGNGARERVLALFEKVRLGEPERIYRAFPHELSGGQKQRVMIAMALSCDPALLIADEPTTALDVTVQKEILELLRELQAELGMAIIFISHDLGVIREIANRVLVMRHGEIVEKGKVDELFRRPVHPYTQGLLACRPPLAHRLRRLPVVEDFMEQSTAAPDLDAQRQSLIIDEAEGKRRLEELHQKAPLLSVRDLHTWFPLAANFLGRPTGFVKAVNGVSFDVFPGETVGLVGESGCGKTTLGRTILRLAEARSGKVLFEGRDILQMPAEALRQLRREVQIIFQDPYASLNPRMSIGQAILEPMRAHGIESSRSRRKERAVELLEKVQLPADYYHRYPHEFSGGQRQRVCIARALAVNPRFIICDESVSALDVSIQAQVLNLLKDLQVAHNLTYIFISHDLSVVKFMSDRILVMRQGEIVEAGPAHQIYRQPKEEYTRRLIEAIPGGGVWV